MIYIILDDLSILSELRDEQQAGPNHAAEELEMSAGGEAAGGHGEAGHQREAYPQLVDQLFRKLRLLPQAILRPFKTF